MNLDLTPELFFLYFVTKFIRRFCAFAGIAGNKSWNNHGCNEHKGTKNIGL
jgi:hypothetical protein